jgi:hypothetical protein
MGQGVTMATKGREVPAAVPMNGIDDNGNPVKASSSRWRQQAVGGVWYKMPTSDEPALLRRPGLQAMVGRAGSVPNPLTAEIMRFLAVERDPLKEYTEQEKMAMYERNSQAFVQLAAMCFVEPRVVLDRPADELVDGEIAPEWIPDYDLAWLVFSFIEGEAASLAKFRIDGVAASNGATRLGSAEIRTLAIGAGEGTGSTAS